MSAARQQVVDLVLLRDRREVDLDTLAADHVDREVQHREHAQAEEVELHEARSRAVVLVPLQDRPAFHARPLDRAVLDERAVGHHHAAGVDAEVARKVEHLARELECKRRDRGRTRGRFGPVERHTVACLVADRTFHSSLVARRDDAVVLVGLLGELAERFGAGGPAVDPLAERVGLARREPGRLRHLAQRTPRAIRDDVRHLRAAVAAVALVHVLNDFFAALVFDVEVDVGRSVALR